MVEARSSKDAANGCSGQAAAQHCNMLKHLDSHVATKGDPCKSDKEGVRLASREEVDVEKMGKEDLEEVRRLLIEAEEVAMTLVYSDGTTQLRNAEVYV